jgi:hypothetical protein
MSNKKPSGGGGGNKPSGGGGNKPSGGGGNKPSGGGKQPSGGGGKQPSGGGGNKPSGGGGNKPSGGGTTINVGGQKVNVGKTFGAGDINRIQQIAPGVNLGTLQSKVQGKDIKIGSGAKTVFRDAATATVQQQKEQDAANQRAIFEDILSEYGGFSGGGDFNDLPEGYVSLPEYEAGLQGANLDVQKQIAQLEQAAATERLKYEVDNRIPVVQEENKGKIDLQKIVNRGYENIARIERGSDMVRSITSMFNF